MSDHGGLKELYCIKESKKRSLGTTAQSVVNCNEVKHIIEAKIPLCRVSREASSLIQKYIGCIVEYVLLSSLTERSQNKKEILVVGKEDIKKHSRQIVELLVKTKRDVKDKPTHKSIARCLRNNNSSIHPLLLY